MNIGPQQPIKKTPFREETRMPWPPEYFLIEDKRGSALQDPEREPGHVKKSNWKMGDE